MIRLTDDEQVVLNSLPQKAVRNFPKRHGVEWTHEEAMLIVSLWTKGETQKDIAALLKRTPGAISSRLNKLTGEE